MKQNKNNRINIRCTDYEKEVLLKRAERVGLSLSKYMISVGLNNNLIKLE